ncbi:SNF2 family N-terminal domain-containing protein [Boeremia exigua]|uniref:SNF2 family N-terminal domain-containing protein n=1 Tax=Boeremia exigua TaxID=749465 RepID=UPI001E8CDB35|nr:SNF2 family N-terminal domain-containing protein [Boeremia exigua]KAH6622332.1 SNF2 family N-terminal domain-containing protein [Boeremia exigua]
MSLKHMLNDSDDHDFYRARTVPEDWDQYNGDYRGYASIEDSSQEHGVYSPLDPVNIDHLLSMQIWDYDATGPITGHTQLHLSEVDSQYLVTFADGHIFGHVNARMEKALTDMKEQQLQLEFEVFVPTRSTRETLGRATKGQEAVIRAQMNVYGPRISAHSAGQELSQNKFYLQLPDYIRDGTVYENPHMLVFAEDSNAVPTTNVTSEEPNDGTTTDEHFQEVVANVYSSLTRNENLTGLEGHQRLRRPLLNHQKTALEFMSQRENGPIPERYQLWVPTEIEGQPAYRHAVTGRTSRLDHTETGGGILADEMGMGKSLSMLALILRTLDMAHIWASEARALSQSAGASNGRSKATLIVASSDLMINEWFQELAKHFDENTLTTLKYHGQNRRCSVDTLRDVDLVITTYHTLASDYSNGKSFLNQIEWYRLVLDEAHIIRRQNTGLNRSVADIQARARWCLTGTPIQNRLEDIGALFSFLKISPLHNIGEFKKAISVPFAEGGKRRQLSVERFTLLLDSMCLRRTKDLLHLPDPESRIHEIKLSPEERAQYEQTREIMFRAIKNQVGVFDQRSTLSQFQIQLQLRIICNHGTWQQAFSWSRRKLYLLDEREAKEIGMGSHGEATCSACRQTMPLFGLGSMFRRYEENCRHTLCSECLEQSSQNTEDHLATSCPLCSSLWNTSKYPKKQKGHSQEDMYFRAAGKSSKMEALVGDVMKDIATTKSIIFTCWTRTLDLIQLYLKREKLTSKNVQRIDGDYPTNKREKILEEFERSPDLHVLIMTTGTGAVGCVHILFIRSAL